MPLGIQKFFTRKNSGRRSKKQPPVVASRVLSPVSEHSVISVPASDAPRPVPPPQHFSAHPSDYGHHDDYHDDLQEPHSRLYETFTMSEDSRPPVPMVVREDDEDAHLHHVPGSYADEPLHHQLHHDDYPDVHQTDLTDELGYANTGRSGHDRPILIAPSSERSESTGSQKVTFLGDAPSRPRGMPMSHGKSLSATSRSMAGDRPRGIPYATSSHRSDYNRPRRQIPEYLPSLHRAPRHEGYYQQKLPYMIFVDQGHGLEVGNDEDGFMPYQEYLATAHLRRTEEHTYYIIPGSTPVIFNDENGRELYRVDAQKYNTSYLRRNRYIVEDEFGNELCRIGHFGENSSDSYSSRSRSPKVVYVNAEHGSTHRHEYYKNTSTSTTSHAATSSRRRPRDARPYYDNYTNYNPTQLNRSALFEDDEERTDSTPSVGPDIVVVNEDGERVFHSRDAEMQARSNYTRSGYATEISYPNRSEATFVDEYGRALDEGYHHEVEYPWGAASTESDDTYDGSRRRSQVVYI